MNTPTLEITTSETVLAPVLLTFTS
jgi:hypothetical protein